MSEQEKDVKDTEESTDEPDVEAHLQDTFSRDDAFERGRDDAFEERERLDEAL